MKQQICDVLTALRQYLHQAHLLAKGNGYTAHLLINELYDRVNEDIDRRQPFLRRGLCPIVLNGSLEVNESVGREGPKF